MKNRKKKEYKLTNIKANKGLEKVLYLFSINDSYTVQKICRKHSTIKKIISISVNCNSKKRTKNNLNTKTIFTKILRIIFLKISVNLN